MATCGVSQTGSVQSCLNRLLLIFFGFLCTDQKMTIFMCIEIMYNSKCRFEAKFTTSNCFFFFKCSAQVRTAHQSEMKALFYIYSPRFMFLPSLVLLHSPHPQTNPHPEPRLLWAALIPDSASKSQGGEKKKKKQKIKHLNLESATHKEAGWEQMRPFLRELMYILTGFEGSVAGIHRAVFSR